MRRVIRRVFKKLKQVEPIRVLPAVSSGAAEWTTLFDSEFYLRANADCEGLDLLAHYSQYGWRENRAPHALFDPEYYCSQVKDIRPVLSNPLEHYMLHGGSLGYDPHPLFDTQYYLSQNPNLLESKQNPLLHYLTTGAEEGQNTHPLFQPRHFRDQLSANGIQFPGKDLLSFYLTDRNNFVLEPNQYFNGAFYFRKYFDVYKTGMNPLVHYVLFGSEEKRQTHPNFDSSVYIRQFPELLKNGGDALTHYFSAERGQSADCNSWFTPECSRVHQEFLEISKAGKSNILLFSHHMGGGVDKHLDDLAEMLNVKINFFLLRPLSGHPQVLELTILSSEKQRLLFKVPEQLNELIEFLRKLALNRIHVHHIYRLEKYVKNIVEQLALPFDLTIHDYYLLCPNYNLVDEHGMFAGEPVDGSIYRHKERGLIEAKAWRIENSWLLKDAQRVIVPSADTLRRFLDYFPQLNYVLVPHPETKSPTEKNGVRVRPLAFSESLRVAVLGNIMPQKGLAVIEACALRAKELKLPIEFTIIGTANLKSKLTSEDILVTGKYAKGDLKELIRVIEPHIVWFPALWPETFSYTLSEALEAKLPTAVTDLGAFSERLQGRPWSWIMSWRSDAVAWCDFFSKLIEENFSFVKEPIFLDWHEKTASNNFYLDAYLTDALPSGTKELVHKAHS